MHAIYNALERYFCACPKSAKVMPSSPIGITQLPVEILQEILLLLCDSNCISAGKDDIPALILQRVCRRWYYIIIGCGALWATIRLPIRNDPHTTARIEGVLRRCGSFPLALSLAYPEYPLPPAIPWPLIVNSRRIRRLSLTGLDPSTLAAMKGNLDALEELHLDVTTAVDPIINTVFTCAPSLRSVTLSERCRNVHLPWNQLTSLIFTHFGDHDWVVDVLSRCTQLQSVSFLRWKCKDAHLTSRSVVLPQLRSISCRLCNSDAVESTFGVASALMGSLVSCRNVTSFSISYNQREPGNGWDAPPTWNPALMHLSHTLTSLSIDSVQLTTSTLVSILTPLTLLRSFTFHEAIIDEYLDDPIFCDIVTDGFLHQMATTLLGKLAYLSLDVFGKSFTDMALVEMAKARWNQRHSLKSLHVCIRDRKISDKAFENLLAIRNEGLNLEVRDHMGCVFTRKDLV